MTIIFGTKEANALRTPEYAPCPFCGGRKLIVGKCRMSGDLYKFIQCSNCFARGPIVEATMESTALDEIDARRAWNERAEDSR